MRFTVAWICAVLGLFIWAASSTAVAPDAYVKSNLYYDSALDKLSWKAQAYNPSETGYTLHSIIRDGNGNILDEGSAPPCPNSGANFCEGPSTTMN